MMNSILLIYLVVGTMLVALGLLFGAGCLFRRDLARLRAAGADLSPARRKSLLLKDALVPFFAQFEGSSSILRLLAGQKALDEIRFDEQWRREREQFPAGALPVMLGLMVVAGLVRVTRHGLSITEIGREVHRRLQCDDGALEPRFTAEASA